MHPAARLLLPVAVRAHISANVVSLAGLAFGIGAAIAYARWTIWSDAFLGLALSVVWLIADGLDGMIARTTGTSSAFGRVLDGLCDHGVFILIYVSIALSIGTTGGWVLAVLAGAAHAVQSSLYEAERARFHRRVRGQSEPVRHSSLGSPVVRLYDFIAGSLDRMAAPFDQVMRDSGDKPAFGARYGRHAAPAMKAMSLLSANVRVIAIFLACLAGSPRLFWWFELIPLTVIALITIGWHRRVESALVSGVPTFAEVPVGITGTAAPE